MRKMVSSEMWKTLDGSEVWTDALGKRFGERVCVGIRGKKCVKDGKEFTPTSEEKKGIVDSYIYEEYGTTDTKKIMAIEGFVNGTCSFCGVKCDSDKVMCEKCIKTTLKEEAPSAPKSMRGLSFDEQLKLSGFEKVSKTNPCMKLGDIAHDTDPGWQNLFQAKIDSATHDGFRAYCIHEGGWHGYYESNTKECSMGICNCGKKAATPSSNRIECGTCKGLIEKPHEIERGMCDGCNYCCKDARCLEQERKAKEEKWCPYCENSGAACTCTVLETKLRESLPNTKEETLTDTLARTCVAPMDCGFTGKLHEQCDFSEYAKRRAISENLKNDVVYSMKFSAMVDMLEYFLTRYNLMYEDAMRVYMNNWSHHNPKAASSTSKLLVVFRAPYGSDSTPVEDREYKLADIGVGSPVGTISELKTGTITGITGNPMSGLWTIHFMSGASAHIESGYGIRALVACFGSLDDARGKTITYTTDMFGVMVGFSPVED